MSFSEAQVSTSEKNITQPTTITNMLITTYENMRMAKTATNKAYSSKQQILL